jgi:hypothetical protein
VIFNIGNCGSAACAEGASKVRARVAAHQRLVNLTWQGKSCSPPEPITKKRRKGLSASWPICRTEPSRGLVAARRRATPSGASLPGSATTPPLRGRASLLGRGYHRCGRLGIVPRALRPDPERTLVASDRMARFESGHSSDHAYLTQLRRMRLLSCVTIQPCTQGAGPPDINLAPARSSRTRSRIAACRVRLRRDGPDWRDYEMVWR